MMRSAAGAAITSMQTEDMRVRVLGPGAAIAQGRFTETGRNPAGKPVTERGSFLDVWQRRGGIWQLVAVQVTPIPATK